jgi:UDP-glucose 4-epimerase
MVTGAAGFIGSTLTDRLLSLGKKVRGLDSFTDYYPEEIKKSNLQNALKSSSFELVREDLNTVDMDKLLDGVICVFHLAAQAGVRKSWGTDFQVYIDQNIQATQKLLEALKEMKIIRLVYTSSSSVYGDIAELPMKEVSLLKPVSPYGVTKLAAEHLCNLYHKAYGIPVISLRLFTVYGPRQRPDMAFNRFMKSALEGKEIIVYGDGEQTRDFTYVGDVVDAMISASEKGNDGEIYNIGGGHRISLNRLLQKLENISRMKLNLKYIEPQHGEMRHTFADCSKAEKELNYMPGFDLDEGLKNEWEWMKKIR